MTSGKPEFSIFYAWQSDTSSSYNRKLIREAIEAAVEELQGKFPFTITVTSDTQDAPGLCDIPAVILQKLDSADAVVLDLTFVAKSAAENPKHCPNPNVLFELGYAFRAVGHERIVCVMNEDHGPVEATMFDIAHRRHPIRYRGPVAGTKRNEVLEGLSNAIAGALEPTLKMGPRTTGVDSEKEFLREEVAISSMRTESRPKEASEPTVWVGIRPASFRDRYWADAQALEEVLNARQIGVSGRPYPPRLKGNDVMQWGIYNDTRSRLDWAMAYSGQFLLAVGAGAYGELNIAKLPWPDDEVSAYGTLPPGTWIDYVRVTQDVTDAFRFIGSLAGDYHPNELIHWSMKAVNLAGTCLSTRDERFAMSRGCSRKCRSPEANLSGTESAGEFKVNWRERCTKALHELLQRYDLDGRIPFEVVKERVESILGIG